MTHSTCKTVMDLEARTIISLPHDKSWPKDLTVRVPYCPTCKTVVHADEVSDR